MVASSPSQTDSRVSTDNNNEPAPAPQITLPKFRALEEGGPSQGDLELQSLLFKLKLPSVQEMLNNLEGDDVINLARVAEYLAMREAELNAYLSEGDKEKAKRILTGETAVENRFVSAVARNLPQWTKEDPPFETLNPPSADGDPKKMMRLLKERIERYNKRLTSAQNLDKYSSWGGGVFTRVLEAAIEANNQGAHLSTSGNTERSDNNLSNLSETMDPEKLVVSVLNQVSAISNAYEELGGLRESLTDKGIEELPPSGEQWRRFIGSDISYMEGLLDLIVKRDNTGKVLNISSLDEIDTKSLNIELKKVVEQLQQLPSEKKKEVFGVLVLIAGVKRIESEITSAMPALEKSRKLMTSESFVSSVDTPNAEQEAIKLLSGFLSKQPENQSGVRLFGGGWPEVRGFAQLVSDPNNLDWPRVLKLAEFCAAYSANESKPGVVSADTLGKLRKEVGDISEGNLQTALSMYKQQPSIQELANLVSPGVLAQKWTSAVLQRYNSK
jgi:hypothetical protein